MTNLTPMPVPDTLRTAYIQAHTQARAFERHYCELLEDIARAQAERTRTQRRKRVKVARTPAWIQTTRRPEAERRSALLIYHHDRWSYSSRGTKGAA